MAHQRVLSVLLYAGSQASQVELRVRLRADSSWRSERHSSRTTGRGRRGTASLPSFPSFRLLPLSGFTAGSTLADNTHILYAQHMWWRKGVSRTLLDTIGLGRLICTERCASNAIYDGKALRSICASADPGPVMASSELVPHNRPRKCNPTLVPISAGGWLSMRGSSMAHVAAVGSSWCLLLLAPCYPARL